MSGIMAAPALAVTGVGMVAGVGLDCQAACAAIRCAIDNFQETHFVDAAGERILGCEVPLGMPWRGRPRLLRMAADALAQAVQDHGDVDIGATPLLLCLAEPERPGRIVDDDAAFLAALARLLQQPLHPHSAVVATGRTAAGIALLRARELLASGAVPRVLIVAADSMLSAATLAWHEARSRLNTSTNPNGFIPGEAAAALVIERAGGAGQLACTGIGVGHEAAHVLSGEPLRADGLCQAIRAALADAGCAMHDVAFRISDMSGEQYYFKEAALALLRLLRQRRATFDLWHPADCVGEVGAAAGLVAICVVRMACLKGYSAGPRVLAQLGGDAGARVALVLEWRAQGSGHG